MYEMVKRSIDIIMSILIIVLFSPLLVLIPILIKLETPGPVFADTPKRVGKDGELFRMYKFRSMIANAHELLTKDPKFRKVCEEYKKNSYKLKDDPRITKTGKFIRRFSLDEVPQVINILKGEMSLIGPRAYYPFELKDQQKIYPETKKYVEKILTARPGVTGTWQVGGRSDVNFDKRVKMDAEYVASRSTINDLLIILKTPWAMISGIGAL